MRYFVLRKKINSQCSLGLLHILFAATISRSNDNCNLGHKCLDKMFSKPSFQTKTFFATGDNRIMKENH